MTFDTTQPAIVAARAVSGPAKGILRNDQSANERRRAAWPPNRLILLHYNYNIANTMVCAQTKDEYELDIRPKTSLLRGISLSSGIDASE